jgi:hypothetical protein
MPRLVPFRLAAACALALTLVLSTAATAIAKGPVADLRVVNTAGKALTEDSLGASTVTVKTSRRATCFGPGNGGSGKPATIEGPTALGLLVKASKSTRSLRPLLLTDAFDFGLGLCGAGGLVPKDEGSWYLKVNHKSPSVGGDSVKLKKGDEVLWYLASSFPYPDELALVAPRRTQAGRPFTVRVFSYDEKGKRQPVAGASVSGAAAPTGSDGRTTVTLSRPARLIARKGKEIPSAREAVCVGGKCPRK